MTPRLLIPALCLIVSPLFAQVTPPPTTPPIQPPPPASPTENFKETSPGILQLGLVTLEPVKHVIKIPAVVSVKEGPAISFLVGAGGKTEESILTTQAQLEHVRQAMLYLGFKEPSDPIPASPVPTVTGQGVPIRISVHWQMDGKEQEAPAENWILNNKIQEPMPAGDWLYSSPKNPAATIVSIVADLSALINNPNPDNQKQEIWKARSDAVPPVGTMVEVRIQWPDTQSSPLPPASKESSTPLPPAAPLTPAPDPAPKPPQEL